MVDGMDTISSEELACWYLRLNGFFLLPGFVVHPDFGSMQQTEADALAIRLPYRAEALSEEYAMVDDPLLLNISKDKNKPLILIVEVKRNMCSINNSLCEKEKKVIHRILKTIGPVESFKVPDVADSLYEKGIYCNGYTIALVCFGGLLNEELQRSKPDIAQILWDDVINFIYERFNKYRNRKASHAQWDDTGHYLWNMCVNQRKDKHSIIKELKAKIN